MDVLEQGQRYTDDSFELCVEELTTLRTEMELLRARIERLENGGEQCLLTPRSAT